MTVNFIIGDSWKDLIDKEMNKEYFQKIRKVLENESVYPPVEEIFSWTLFTPKERVKVVIIGQDPYHNEGQANGLAFSVKDGVKLPPSLRNIFKELESDLKIKRPTSGNLEKWAKEGVLLLNTSLTVKKNSPLSHSDLGWNRLTDKVIASLQDRENIVYILWGKHAQKKGKAINRSTNHVIESHHPSPLSASRGFFGSKPFSKANDYLRKHNIDAIDWSLE